MRALFPQIAGATQRLKAAIFTIYKGTETTEEVRVWSASGRPMRHIEVGRLLDSPLNLPHKGRNLRRRPSLNLGDMIPITSANFLSELTTR
jgi:hypothetical protein